MKCVCTQTRPRFILSSERVLGGMEFEPMLTPREKSLSTGKFPQRRIEPATLWTASPSTTNELFRPPKLPLFPLLCLPLTSQHLDRLVGLVVRRPPRERKVRGSNPASDGIFSGSNHTCDLNIGTPVATLPGAWRYRVSAGTGRPSVSIL